VVYSVESKGISLKPMSTGKVRDFERVSWNELGVKKVVTVRDQGGGVVRGQVKMGHTPKLMKDPAGPDAEAPVHSPLRPEEPRAAEFWTADRTTRAAAAGFVALCGFAYLLLFSGMISRRPDAP
jgi:hypothetical protein